MKNFSKKEWTEFFSFLDALRESGVTNMYGSSPYVMEEFNVKRDDAASIVLTWMKTFSREKTPAERAAEVTLTQVLQK